MFCFHAARGGVGCSVVAAASALHAPKATPTLLVDLTGDGPALLGLPSQGATLDEWLDGPPPAPGSLGRLARSVAPGLRLLTVRRRGPGSVLDPSRVALLLQALAELADRVIIDVGVPDAGTAPAVAAADRAIMVSRACHLAATTAGWLPTPDGVVVVREIGRALRSRDIADAIGAPLLAEIVWDEKVARAVDAGTFVSRLPRSLRPLGGLW